MLFSQSALLSCTANVLVCWFYSSDMQVATPRLLFQSEEKDERNSSLSNTNLAIVCSGTFMNVCAWADCHYDEIILVYDFLSV